MKKSLKLLGLCSLFLSLGITSCGNSDKVNYLVSDYDNAGFVDITQEKLDTLRSEKNDFVIFVHTQGCLTCAEVEGRLKHYIDDYGLMLYRITYKSLNSDDELKKSSSTAPIIGFYKEGKSLKIAPYSKNQEHFESQETFNKFFETYVTLPSFYYISPEMLDKKISDKENFVVLFTRSTCSDCGYLFSHMLDKYMEENHDKLSFYLLECDKDGIRNYDEAGNLTNAEEWQAFKDKYQLSASTSSEYGYSGGVVPTFQYYKDGLLCGSDVYVNDSFKQEIVSGEETTGQTVKYKFTVTESFFFELVGQSFEYETTYYAKDYEGGTDYLAMRNKISLAKKDFVSTVHDAKLKEFLNKYATK